MGCDIHMFIEYKKPSDTEWKDGNLYKRVSDEDTFEAITLKSESRNYELFAALANVRGDGGICDPRGLPNDISKRAFITVGSWGHDAHSTSYFTLAELIEHLSNYPILQNLVDELNYHKRVIDYFIEPDNLRVIFWFDN